MTLDKTDTDWTPWYTLERTLLVSPLRALPAGTRVRLYPRVTAAVRWVRVEAALADGVGVVGVPWADMLAALGAEEAPAPPITPQVWTDWPDAERCWTAWYTLRNPLPITDTWAVGAGHRIRVNLTAQTIDTPAYAGAVVEVCIWDGATGAYQTAAPWPVVLEALGADPATAPG